MGIIWFGCSKGASKTKLAANIAVSPLFSGNRFPQKSLDANEVTTIGSFQQVAWQHQEDSNSSLESRYLLIAGSWF